MVRKQSMGRSDSPIGQRTGLSVPLRQLVADPKRLGSVRLWDALSDDEKREATRALLDSEETARRGLNGIIANARHYRPKTVSSWSTDQVCEALCRVPLPDHRVAARLLECHHIPGQRTMVVDFLDALGVSHREGITESYTAIDGSDDAVRTGVARLLRKYHAERVATYVLTLCLYRAPVGERARTLLMELLAEPADNKDLASLPLPSEPEDTTPTAEERQTEREDPSRQPSFTTLDRVLIYAAVDSAENVEGALSPMDLDDLVGEVIALNGRRHKSYFHAGFRDVLFDNPIAEELPAENAARLRWYWTGAIQGWARGQRWDRIVREYENHPVVQELGNGSDAASVAAVRHISEALHRGGRAAEIADFVNVRTLLGQPRLLLFGQLLEVATELLDKGSARKALPILETLMNARDALERSGVSPTDRRLLDAHRRRAHCLRQLHFHDRARRRLEELLELESDPKYLAMIHADLGLMAGGFDGLEEVILPPSKDELDGMLERLERGKGHFVRSRDLQGRYSAHSHYCLGVLALGRAVEDQVFEAAEMHLQQARNHFSEDSDSYRKDLVSHANLYFGIAKAQEFSADKLAHAADVITEALASGARIPHYLINPTTEAFGLKGVEADLKKITQAIAETGDAALDELVWNDSGLHLRRWLADKLWERAKDTGRLPNARAKDFRAAFHGFLGRGNSEAAGEVLDRLEGLARANVATSTFLNLLENERVYDASWEYEDVIVARARFHEARGDLTKAVGVLRDLFHRLVTEERLTDAAGVLEKVRGYGTDPDIYADMTNRYDALSARMGDAATASTTEAPAVVRVLVVGAELGASEEQVHDELRDHVQSIRVSFVRTDWKQNWKRKLSEIRNEMKRCDALVIQPFMRTHLGRAIRQAWDGPRRSCWGSGPKMISETVKDAAGTVRRT